MKIRYLKNKDINKQKWNKAIDEAKNGLIYAYSWYLDIIAENWNAIINEDYSLVMPIVCKSKYLVKYVYQPHFAQQLGIFYKKELKKSDFFIFINLLKKKFKFIEININFYNNYNLVNAIEKVNYVLYLNKNYKEISLKFNKSTYKNLKKANKSNLFLKDDLNPKQIINFKKENLYYFLNSKNLFIFYKLIKFAKENNRGEGIGVYNNKNELIACRFFLFSHNRIYDLLAASNTEGRKKSASFLIINEIIKKNSNKNFILDFKGSQIKGVANFFFGWGAVKENYYYLRNNNLPFPLKQIKNKLKTREIVKLSYSAHNNNTLAASQLFSS